MSPPPNQQHRTSRRCAFCGTPVPEKRTQCPHCREALAEVPAVRPRRSQAPGVMRRGILYAAVALGIYYVASGRAPINLPVPAAPIVLNYLVPLLLACGLGQILWGLYSYLNA